MATDRTKRPALLLTALSVLCSLAVASPGAAATGRIIDGAPVSATDVSRDGRWGSLVSVVTSTDADVRLCTGTLIAPNWVVTAAHCVGRTNNTGVPVAADDVEVMAGSNGVDTDLAASETVSVHQHPGFNGVGPWDIALIQLADLLPRQPMPLPDPSRLGSYGIGTADNVAGFGRSAANDEYSIATLRSGRLEPVDAETCEAAVPGSTVYADCMAPGAARQIVCFGDSGGPVVRFDALRGGAPTLWGVVSTAPADCSTGLDVLSVQTRVASTLTWIADTIRRTQLTETDQMAVTVTGPAWDGGSQSSADLPQSRVLSTRVERKPTRRRGGRVRVAVRYSGGAAKGHVRVRRCSGDRCTTSTDKHVRFTSSKTTQRRAVPLPRCTRRATIEVRFHVTSGDSVRERAAKQVVRCR